MKYLVDGFGCFWLLFWEVVVCRSIYDIKTGLQTNFDYFWNGVGITLFVGIFVYVLLTIIRDTLKNKKLTIGQK